MRFYRSFLLKMCFGLVLALLSTPSWAAVGVEACGDHPLVTSSKISGAFFSGSVTPDDSTDCIVRFARPKATPPRCVVTWRDSLQHMHYSVTSEYIAIVQSRASVTIDWKCSDD
jgi:hypothetical protein